MISIQRFNSIIKKLYTIFCVNPFINNKLKYTKLYFISLFIFLLGYASIDFPPFPPKIEDMGNMNGTLIGYGHCGRSSTCVYLENKGDRYRFTCVYTSFEREDLRRNIGENVIIYYDRYGFLYRKMRAYQIACDKKIIIYYDYEKVLFRSKIFFTFGIICFISLAIILMYIFLKNRRDFSL